MAWSDAARAAAAETRRRNKILNAPVDHLVRNKSGTLVIRKRAPSQKFKNDVLKRVKSGRYNWDDNGQRGIGPTGKTRTSRMMKAIRNG